VGYPDGLSPKVVASEEERKEAEIRKRSPHLSHTSEFQSFGEINQKTKRRSLVGLH
jgi:hypothetical protein